MNEKDFKQPLKFKAETIAPIEFESREVRE